MDAINVLKFMASNGLVSNLSKTTLMFLNLPKNENHTVEIKVGKATVTQEKQAKLLGIVMDDNQGWDSLINGTGGMISSLNSRLFLIRRLSNSLNKSALRKVADSIIMQ